MATSMTETSDTSDPVEDFRKAAMAKGDGVVPPTSRDHDLHAEMTQAVAVLRTRDDRGLAALRSLAGDQSPHVRQWAAAELLSRGDTSVIPMLEEFAAEGGLLRLSAAVLLKEFRAGRLRSPFPLPRPEGT
jgi:hypothetical protein